MDKDEVYLVLTWENYRLAAEYVLPCFCRSVVGSDLRPSVSVAAPQKQHARISRLVSYLVTRTYTWFRLRRHAQLPNLLLLRCLFRCFLPNADPLRENNLSDSKVGKLN